MKDSLVLVGMPGSGKSTIGVLLAKKLCLRFVDTDLVIQEREGMSLQNILARHGQQGFLDRERAAILSIQPAQSVVATGGSVVLIPEAMRHLCDSGFVVFIDVPVRRLERRVRNMKSRGIVLAPGQTLRDLESLRKPHYLRYADWVFRSGSQKPAEAANRIAEAYLSS
ncbi:MAG: shikimate kinase [Clostridiaceae bacterium]|jgi:shikimate kinase|nr:shikimate kinase [Clostridiaceae bacterium]